MPNWAGRLQNPNRNPNGRYYKGYRTEGFFSKVRGRDCSARQTASLPKSRYLRKNSYADAGRRDKRGKDLGCSQSFLHSNYSLTLKLQEYEIGRIYREHLRMPGKNRKQNQRVVRPFTGGNSPTRNNGKEKNESVLNEVRNDHETFRKLLARVYERSCRHQERYGFHGPGKTRHRKDLDRSCRKYIMNSIRIRRKWKPCFVRPMTQSERMPSRQATSTIISA